MTPTFDSDADRTENRGKPRPKGHIPYRPDRDATLPEWRHWLSDAIGLPAEVRVDAVIRHGQDDADPLTVVLSNGLKMRCPHQKRLQTAGSLQAFFASHSNGIAQPAHLTGPEAGDVFLALCVVGTETPRADPVGDLHEYLAMFVGLCEEIIGSLVPEQRYATLQAIRQRLPFDKSAAQDMHGGKPNIPPVKLYDTVTEKRYVRASEWITYLRHVVTQTVDPSALVARMRELGSERIDPQAWNDDRSYKAHVVLYSLPEAL